MVWVLNIIRISPLQFVVILMYWVHRLLEARLDGTKYSNQDELEKLCKHSSDQRTCLQQEAERASVKYKQVEFMSDKIGQTF